MASSTFTTPGTSLWTLPANIDVNTPISVTLKGAGGGGSRSGGGGGGVGGTVTGLLSLAGMTPGVTQLQINVGGNGVKTAVGDFIGGAGGTNGGGKGGNGGGGNAWGSSGGGGATDIRTGAFGLADRKAVAGGGGGATYWAAANGGAGGAATGMSGFFSSGSQTVPTGGTQAAGGAAGTNPAGLPGNAGASGVGGAGGLGGGGTTGEGGGGGGGGYFGGGGGGGTNTQGNAATGAGGSNYNGGLTSVTSTQGTGSVSGVDGSATLLYNLVPDAPALTPFNNGDDTIGIPVAWLFSDPDAGDTQASADVRWRIGSGAWTTITAAASTASSYTFPAGTFATVIGQSVEWQVRTTDNHSAVGPWSTSQYFTPRTESATVPTVTVQSPNFSSSTPNITITSSTPFRFYRLAVSPAPGGGYAEIFGDAGASVTSVTFNLPSWTYTNLTSYTFTARTTPYNNVYVWGASGSAASAAAIAAPNTPTITGLTSDPFSGAVSFTITNTTVETNKAIINWVYRTDLTSGTPEQRISASTPINSVFTDWQAPLNMQLRYRVVGIAANGNGTSSA